MQIDNASGLRNFPEDESFSEENVEEQESVEDQESSAMDELEAVLSEFENAPDRGTLETWKYSFGEIYTSSINDNDFYVWRTVKRQEYKTILGTMAENASEMMLEEAIIRKCLLFPSPSIEFVSQSRAGVIPTLYSQIMFNSGFIPREIALNMIRKI